MISSLFLGAQGVQKGTTHTHMYTLLSCTHAVLPWRLVNAAQAHSETLDPPFFSPLTVYLLVTHSHVHAQTQKVWLKSEDTHWPAKLYAFKQEGGLQINMGSQQDTTDALYYFPCVAADMCSAHKFPQRTSCVTCRLEYEGKRLLLVMSACFLFVLIKCTHKQRNQAICFEMRIISCFM